MLNQNPPNKLVITASEYEAIQKAAQTTQKQIVRRRLNALKMRYEGKTNQEIADALGFAGIGSITQLCIEFKKRGLERYISHQFSGNRRILAKKDVQDVVTCLNEKVQNGEAVSVNSMQEALSKKLGSEVGMRYVYRVMHRYHCHEWVAMRAGKSKGRPLSKIEEQAVLARFIAQAQNGEKVKFTDIKAAFEEIKGQAIGRAVVDRIINRHRCRELLYGHLAADIRHALSVEEELAVLTPFMKKAEAGEPVTLSEVKAAFIQKRGKIILPVYVHRVLARHHCQNLLSKSKRRVVGQPKK